MMEYPTSACGKVAIRWSRRPEDENLVGGSRRLGLFCSCLLLYKAPEFRYNIRIRISILRRERKHRTDKGDCAEVT